MSSSCSNSGKRSWPELVGIDGELASRIIERENTNVDAIVVSEDNFGTTVFNCLRVRVKVDSSGIVTSTPRIG